MARDLALCASSAANHSGRGGAGTGKEGWVGSGGECFGKCSVTGAPSVLGKSIEQQKLKIDPKKKVLTYQSELFLLVGCCAARCEGVGMRRASERLWMS